MKTIGLIGGMSWESTAQYYALLNRSVAEKLGGLHSARCLLSSLDFQPIEEMQHDEQWSELGVLLADEAVRLEKGGADMILLCTNTMHIVSDAIERAITVPFLHIADIAAEECKRISAGTVGLLGTAFTMERAFYRDRLRKQNGLHVLIPEPAERSRIHEIIYQELCRGVIDEGSRLFMTSVTENLRARGAEAVIMGCTEIPMILKREDCPVPLVDTVGTHVARAVALAMDN